MKFYTGVRNINNFSSVWFKRKMKQMNSFIKETKKWGFGHKMVLREKAILFLFCDFFKHFIFGFRVWFS